MNKDNLVAEQFLEGMFNFHKLILKDKPHIKKYNKLRKLHSEIVDNMEEYLNKGKYDRNKYFNIIKPEIQKAIPNINIYLDSNNPSDNTFLEELFIYKTHNLIPSITEIYLKTNKFRNLDKIKMLESMNKSYVSLFKVIDSDISTGTVIYQDVFTNKRYKVIDISMSASLAVTKRKDIYIYNRIITYEDISFGTGIDCILYYDNKYLRKFLKEKKHIKYSDFTKCLIFYDIKQKSI